MRNDKTMIYFSDFELLSNTLTNFWYNILKEDELPKTLVFADYAWTTIKEFKSLKRFIEMEPLKKELDEIFDEIQTKEEMHTREEMDRLDAKFSNKEKEMLLVFKRVMKRVSEMMFNSYSELIEKTVEPSEWMVLAAQRKWKNEGLIAKLKSAGRREDRRELSILNKQICASVKEFMLEMKGGGI